MHQVVEIILPCLQFALCGAALIEAATILVQNIPPDIVSQELLLQMMPASLREIPLRLTYASATGCILGTGGGLLRMWCHRALGRFFTWQLAVRDDHKLITTGPYAYVQHPGYIGWLLMTYGNFILVLSKGSIVVESGVWGTTYGRIGMSAVMGYVGCAGLALLTRMRKECDVLREQFGAEWEAYARRTPYWLIPYIY